MKFRRSLSRSLVVAIALITASGVASAAEGDTACPEIIGDSFASSDELARLTEKVASFGLRSTGSEAHENNISWIAEQFAKMPGFVLAEDYIDIERWEPLPLADNLPGRSLEKAATLRIGAGETGRNVVVAGAIPYSKPTGSTPAQGELVYISDVEDLTKENVAGKVVIVDIPEVGISYATLMMTSRYFTDDLWGKTFQRYTRPYMGTNEKLGELLVKAGLAKAAGLIAAFDVPRDQIAGYFDPHLGTHFRVPAAFVGVDEAIVLKEAAKKKEVASLVVDAVRDKARSRNLLATLPGRSKERIVFVANTDGNTWVQENANAGLVALADYFSKLPLTCRPRTLEFSFGTAHLHMSREGTHQYAQQIDDGFETGTAVLAFAVEHLGTREIEPVERQNGPGRELRFTGEGENMGWFVGPSQPLIDASIEAIKHRNLDKLSVLRGLDLPNPSRTPTFCSFGGIGTYFHAHLVPTIALISGPWSLWAPSFGKDAVDFNRMRNQLLAVGDTALKLGSVPAEELAGDYVQERKRRAEGWKTCELVNPPEEAPAPSE
ncbi:TPA: hypothetical protein ACP31J_005888 [Pseudomonas aeruginosa]